MFAGLYANPSPIPAKTPYETTRQIKLWENNAIPNEMKATNIPNKMIGPKPQYLTSGDAANAAKNCILECNDPIQAASPELALKLRIIEPIDSPKLQSIPII